MSNKGKSLALALVLVMAISSASLLTVKLASAQTAPTPSTPVFTIQFVNSSYTVTTTNPYNGQNTTQLISNMSIEITINNQPFAYSYNGTNYQIYYNVRLKPHFSTVAWSGAGEESYEVFPVLNSSSSPPDANGISSYAWRIEYGNASVQSNTNYTTISAIVAPVGLGYDIRFSTNYWTVPTNAQVDFQVEALIGHDSQFWGYRLTPTFAAFSFTGVAYDSDSYWSDIHTLNLTDGLDYTTPNTSSSPNVYTTSNLPSTPIPTTSPTPTSTPTVPEFPALAILPLFAVLASTVLIGKRLQSKHEQN